MTDPQNKAAGRGEATGDANLGQASTNCSRRHRGKRIDVGKLREAINNPPLCSGLLHDLRRTEPTPAEYAAACRDAVERLEREYAAATSDAERAAIAPALADALEREVVALRDIVGGVE